MTADVSREWLEKSLNNNFNELFENKAKAGKASRDFVKFITGRAWVMSEIGENVFSFTHQTFLEYFFARFLDDKFDTVYSLLNFLKPRILRQEWNEVAHLALQLKTHRSIRKQEEAIEILSRFIDSARNMKQQNALLKFSGRSLEYISPTEKSIGDLLDKCIVLSLGIAQETGGEALYFTPMATNSARERRKFVVERAENILSSLILGNDKRLARSAVTLINRSYSFSYYEDAEIGSAAKLPLMLCDSIKSNSKAVVLDRAEKDALFAGLAWQWYGDFQFDRLLKFGLSVLINHPHIGSILISMG